MYKYKRFLKLFLVFSCLHIGKVLPQAKVKVKNDKSDKVIEVLSRQESDLINFFYRPINFNQGGIEYYFKHVYNHPEYTQYLPYNLSHMIQFLDYGTKSNQTEAFAASVVKLFMQKIKATPFIEAETFVEFLPKLAKAIEPYLDKKEVSFLQDMQDVLKDRLTHVFSKYFSYFQKNPDAFMNSLAEQIAKQTNHQATLQHVEIEQFKKDILRFLELCANKLVWSSKDDLQVWHTCNKLAYESGHMLEKKLLSNQDALDDLYWSFIHRFCYFVELSADTLSKEFYDQVLHDLQTKPLVLTSLEEQEDLITSKRSHLIQRVQMYKDTVYPKLFDSSLMKLTS